LLALAAAQGDLTGETIQASLRRHLARQWARVRDLLIAWDTDCDGKVDRDEFIAAMRQLGLSADFQVSEAALDGLFTFFDTDGSGALEFHELHERLRQRPEAPTLLTPSRHQRTLRPGRTADITPAWNYFQAVPAELPALKPPPVRVDLPQVAASSTGPPASHLPAPRRAPQRRRLPVLAAPAATATSIDSSRYPSWDAADPTLPVAGLSYARRRDGDTSPTPTLLPSDSTQHITIPPLPPAHVPQPGRSLATRSMRSRSTMLDLDGYRARPVSKISSHNQRHPLAGVGKERLTTTKAQGYKRVNTPMRAADAEWFVNARPSDDA